MQARLGTVRKLRNLCGLLIIITGAVIVMLHRAPAETTIYWTITALLVLASIWPVLWSRRIERPPAACPESGLLTGRDWVFLGALAVLLLFCFLPIMDQRGHLTFFRTDMIRYYGFNYYLRETVIEHGLLPLWSQYGGGGFPMAGHPEFIWPSPFMLFHLCAGELLGQKLYWWFLTFIQGVGMYLAGRIMLRLGPAGASAASLAAAFSPWLPRAMSDGDYYSVSYAFTALLLVLLFGRRSRRGLCAAALLFASLSFDGYYYLFSIGVFLAVFAVTGLVRRHGSGLYLDILPLRAVISMALLCMLAGAVKYLPAARLMHRTDLALRHFIDPEEGMVGGEPFYAPGFIDAYRLAEVPALFIYRSAFLRIGPVMTLFGLLGWLRCRAGGMRWLWTFWITLTLTLAYNSPIDIFGCLWRSAGFVKVMRHPNSYFEYFLMLILLAGFGITIDWLATRRRWGRAAAVLIGVITLAPLIYSHQSRLTALAAIQSNPEDHLRRYAIPDGPYSVAYQGTHNGREYPLIRKGIGTLDWYSTLQVPTSVQPRFFAANDRFIANEHYRGEAFFVNGGAVSGLAITATRISARVEDSGLLVVNQNYHDGWRAKEGVVVNVNGLLGLMVAPGQRRIDLRYYDPAFFIGLFITLCALGGMSACLVPGRRFRSA
ncbi:hypothetical protein JW905_01080 [bacterium]|nr:hypothetical protein [candidate division CSSED10-310 bacterium]